MLSDNVVRVFLEDKIVDCLGVFPEGVVAFCASEELGCAFVAASGLHLPSVGSVVSAFWTCYVGDGHSTDLMLLCDYGYAFLGWTLNGLGNSFCALFCFFLVSTFWAYGLNCDFVSFLFALGDHAGSTLWTKFHKYTPILLPQCFCQLLNISFLEKQTKTTKNMML
jgi:hypothetical protein